MRELTVVLHGTQFRCVVERTGGEFIVHAGTRVHRLRLTALEPGVLHLTIAGHSQPVHVARDGERWYAHLDGQTLEYQIAIPGLPRHGPARHLRDDLSAPMPGSVTQVQARAGDTVTAGQPLVIIEAMKMEHVIRAPRMGRVQAVRVRPGDQVEGGAILVELAAEPGIPDSSSKTPP